MAKGETYTEFVDKFKPKLTTDDCYTPTEIYYGGAVNIPEFDTFKELPRG